MANRHLFSERGGAGRARGGTRGGRGLPGGTVHKGKIKFGAVRVGAKYKGTVRGTSMSGTWTSPQGGGSWSAHKAS